MSYNYRTGNRNRSDGYRGNANTRTRNSNGNRGSYDSYGNTRPSEDLGVTDIDLLIKDNAVIHRTDRYAATKRDTERDGRAVPQECVVRRGDIMTMNVTFNTKFDAQKNDLTLRFKIGDIIADVKADDRKNYNADEWGASLLSTEGTSAKVEVYIPFNCTVGKWDLYAFLSDGSTRVKYKHPRKVIILFNPWCKYDMVFTNEDKDEYVLNENGKIYQGTENNMYPKTWSFSQFADMILDCSLYLMEVGLNNNYEEMADASLVSRALAAMVNQADDNGVLIGRWDGNYGSDVPPWHWGGSKKILQQYFKSKRPVKYAQCWVFSGVLTTVCRALGIPCRSVTNFSSAHDTDRSASIDTYYDEDMNIRNDKTKDSVWNFHVWNEVYLNRKDVPNRYQGWQVIDSTPQERSGHMRRRYTTGPASVAAIKEGKIDYEYDGGFVFAEVNADRVSWIWKPRKGWTQGSIETKAIGKKISTKLPKSNERLDLTDTYKYPEGSTEERKAVALAVSLSENPMVTYNVKPTEKPVTVQIYVDDNTMIGKDLETIVEVKNNSGTLIMVDKVWLLYFREMYDGSSKGLIYYRELSGNDNKFLDKGRSQAFQNSIPYWRYGPRLLENCYVFLVAFVIYKPNQYSREEERVIVEHNTQLQKPNLDVQGPSSVKLRDEVTFNISFRNPLPVDLTGCSISVDSSGFRDRDEIRMPDVASNGVFSQSVKVRSDKEGEHEIVFEFDCNQLYALQGSKTVNVVY